MFVVSDTCFNFPESYGKKFIRGIISLLLAVLFLSPQTGNAAVETFNENELRKAAEAGDTDAQLLLGTYYFNQSSQETTADYERACHWFRQAANADHPEGMYNLAVCLENGFGVNADKQEALRLYRLAGARGLLPARMQAALLALELDASPEGMDAVLDELHALAAIPYPPALNELGKISAAAAEAAKAAGDPVSAEKYYGEAIVFYSSAADAGFVPACRNAARLILETGSAPAKAREYLLAAAMQNDSEAMAQLAFCMENGIGSEGSEDMAEIKRLYEQAAAAGNPAALLRLGEMLLEGAETTPPDPEKAFEYFTQASESGHPAAALRLGICYANGQGTEKNIQKAAEYFLIAARADIREAQFNLACLFFKGDGLPKDDSAAFYWFRRAAGNGDIRACRQTAYCCFNGIGTKRDDAEGIKWLTEAAARGDTEAKKLLTGE